jgi:hypothetical protein
VVLGAQTGFAVAAEALDTGGVARVTAQLPVWRPSEQAAAEIRRLEVGLNAALIEAGEWKARALAAEAELKRIKGGDR